MGDGDESAHIAVAQNKKLHPFFVASKILTRPLEESIVTPVTPDPSCSPGSDRAPGQLDHEDDQSETGHEQVEGHQSKRRKTDSSVITMDHMSDAGRRRGRKPRVSACPSIVDQLGQNSNTLAESTTNVTKQNLLDHHESHETSPSTLAPRRVASIAGSEGGQISTTNETAAADQADGRQKKILKFNPQTGTIGSPPKPKQKSAVTPDNAPLKTGAKRGRKPKSRLALICYGQDNESRARIGHMIAEILSGTDRVTRKQPPISGSGIDSSPRDQDTQKPVTPKKSGVKSSAIPKVTHPFFLGKPKANSSTQKDQGSTSAEPPATKRQSIFTSTPCSPKRERERAIAKNFSVPQFGMKGGGLRVPGAQHPAWPWQGAVHVRGHPPGVEDHVTADYNPRRFTSKKAKGRQSWIPKHESLLQQLTCGLELSELVAKSRSDDTDRFQPPPPSLRLPTRHFESGKKLQERIRPQLSTPRSKLHPAVSVAYDSLCSELSAFDKSTCESVAWAQKHAPMNAEHVLQGGREASLLREWLKTLTIQAVDTGAQDSAKTKAPAPAKKRRRKKLDDFVVSSEDESEMMDELSAEEAVGEETDHWGDSHKTVMKPISKNGRRLTNAVLLSGPHGCGKTATVYAIARELNFEVFEINPGARRAGKDILEKVGDMTRNHLVQHHQKEETNGEDQTDRHEDDEVTRDLKSGKQGMMTSFFQPKLAKPAQKSQNIKDIPERSSEEAPKASPKESKKQAPKSQKQSLILLEEADILYDEDKQFWPTIMTMIAQSKRPFIITCNDENLVPFQSLNLHGIFRFQRPPRDSAIDLLLLIAAKEGHAINRGAVQTLYETRNRDLRASITELNYWCQIGVGDPQGGVNWFLPRWPRGTDVDDEGDVIRVVSEDTYHRGMGLLGRDPATTDSIARSSAEEVHHQLWENWCLDATSSDKCPDFSTWAEQAISDATSRDQKLAALEVADRFTASLSDADVLSFSSWALHHQVLVDTEYPELPLKTREDFTIGRRLLEAVPLSRYDSNSTDISRAVKLSARTLLAGVSGTSSFSDSSPNNVNELGAVVSIEKNLTNAMSEEPPITRRDYSAAFDPLAESDKAMAAGFLDPSIFDRTMRLISLDVAPYVRSIVAFDQQLQKERLQRSNLLSEGGKPGKKRMRTTRSAYSALEGGARASTRREKYFTSESLNPYLVLRTGGKGWDSYSFHRAEEQLRAQAPSPDESEGLMDASVDEEMLI